MRDQDMGNRGGLELSRPLAAERLGGTVHETRIVASAAERAALAARFGLIALERLEAALRVRAVGPGRRVRVDGHVDAAAVQTCVVSLEPVRSELGEDFTQLYDPDPLEPPAREVIVAPGAEEDEAEPLGPGGLDLGEAVAQQLALMLDPYPRAPGAKLPAAADTGGRADGGGRRPFEVLRTLKSR